MTPKLGLSMLKKVISETINFPALKHYQIKYAVIEQQITFMVFFTDTPDEKPRPYPFDKKAGKSLCEMIDDAVTPYLKDDNTADYVIVDHNDEKISIEVFYTKDGEKLKNQFEL